VREAAKVLTPRESESTGPMLLGDIKAVFESHKNPDGTTDRIWSQDLCDALAAMEQRPWAEWKANKRANPKPLSKNQLARLLGAFHVAPDSVWIADPTIKAGGRTKKGYLLEKFKEVFERYLSPKGVYETEGRKEPTAAGTSADSETEGKESPFRFENSEKSNNDGPPSTLPFRAGGGGQNDAHEGLTPPDDDLSIPGFLDRTKAETALVCNHCGAYERPGKPVELYEVEGEVYWLHSGCHDDWLHAPDPDDCWFNQEDENRPDSDQDQDQDQDQETEPRVPIKVVGPAASGATCVECHQVNGAGHGPVLKIRRADRPGSKTETLHEDCARSWFGAIQ
jgi:Protein of unknown function (DUF3631)